MATSFESKCEILSDLWMNYRDDEEFEDFIAYNDLALPLSYMLASGIIEDEVSDAARGFIDEGFALLLAGFDIDEDTGFEHLDDLLVIEGAITEYETKDFGEFLKPDGEKEEEEEEEEEEESEEEDPIVKSYNEGYAIGYTEGVRDEQNRVQLVCEQAVETYIEAGKGTKAVFWREAAKDLEPIDWENMVIPEDDF